MKLVGMLDSPFVRRVAVTLQILDVDYEHVSQSVVAGYDDFRKINPLAKSPTLICDDGEMLIDSTLIIDYVESRAGRSLMPESINDRRRALQLIGVALAANEKCVQRIYEVDMRPEERRHGPWMSRITQQLNEALDWLEIEVAGLDGKSWFFGEAISQADVTLAVAWRFACLRAPNQVQRETRPALVAFGERAEALPEFLACTIE